jgi:hypothetical protein
METLLSEVNLKMNQQHRFFFYCPSLYLIYKETLRSTYSCVYSNFLLVIIVRVIDVKASTTFSPVTALVSKKDIPY